jgi:hypothetical protein
VAWPFYDQLCPLDLKMTYHSESQKAPELVERRQIPVTRANKFPREQQEHTFRVRNDLGVAMPHFSVAPHPD